MRVEPISVRRLIDPAPPLPFCGPFYLLSGLTVNSSLLCLLAIVASGPAAMPTDAVGHSPSAFAAAVERDEDAPLIIRAQSSPGMWGTADPWTLPTGPTPPPLIDPGFSGGLPQSMPVPTPNIPPGWPRNYGRQPFGVNGPQPYQFGWSDRVDIGVLPAVGTTTNSVPGGTIGDWGIFELDIEKELVTPIWSNKILSISPQFDYRSWDGPGIAGQPGFPESVYRFGLGITLATPDYGGWNLELGYNPAYTTDFHNTNFSDAMQWNRHAVLFWRMMPQWTWAFGAAYWDRVDDIVIPYGGAVWTPNDTWEFRLLFPEPRISVFLGTPFAVPTWLYVRGEYHVESYAIELGPPSPTNAKIQIEDWRVLAGWRVETGAVTTFAELGWVFERDFKLDTKVKGQLHSGLIGRVGVRF